MKKIILSSLLSLALCATVRGAFETYVFPSSPDFTTAIPNGGVIPDNTILGLTDERDLSGAGLAYTIHATDGVNLTLKLAAGASYGDLSGFLRLGNSVGSPSAYFDFGVTSPTITPVEGGINLSMNFDIFSGYNPNDIWTLFLADGDAVGENTLLSWELGISQSMTPVPEPIEWALILFGGLAVFWKFALPRLRPQR